MPPDLSEFLDGRVVSALKSLFPEVKLEPVVRSLPNQIQSVSINLPAAAGADYRFILHVQPEMQIHARLLGCEEERYYFWYRPFEGAEFHDSAGRLGCAFIETVGKLVSHETRITQKRGLLNHSFRCDYRSADSWKRVYGHAALRAGRFRVPQIAGTKRIYHSAPVIPLRDSECID